MQIMERGRLTPEQADEIRRKASALFGSPRDGSGNIEAFRICRRETGLSQTQLAEAAGCSLNTIKNLESGRARFIGAIRESLWTVLLDQLEAKYKRDEPLVERITSLARSNYLKQDQIASLTAEVAELKEKLAGLNARLAEHIDAIRPALEKLEREASSEGESILRRSERRTLAECLRSEGVVRTALPVGAQIGGQKTNSQESEKR